jgi:hypothetical protein
MMSYHACSKCDAPVRRSRRKNLLEFLIGPILLPYRCTICDRREMKLRFIDMTPPPEESDEDLMDLNEAARQADETARLATEQAEEAKKVAARAAARKAKKAVSTKKSEAPEEASPQLHTSDEAEEQTSPS